ncbi:MAG: hypothetical protein WAU39_17150 [Polyangiales bacterium]
MLDHKALAATADESVKLAAEYVGQLGAYADGVRAARDCAEVRAFVHLPLTGQVVEVQLPSLDVTSSGEGACVLAERGDQRAPRKGTKRF